MILHPSTIVLQQFVLHETGAREREKITAHVLRCSRCRLEIDEIIATRDELRELADTPVPAQAWSRIRQRLEEGERIILPAETPVHAPVRRSRMRTVAAAVIFLAAGIGVLGRPPVAEANKSELQFGTSTPAPSAEVSVTYIPSALLGDEESLILRARFRTSAGHAYTAQAGELIRDGDGTYRGVVQLPDSVVYAIFAVEDREAHRLDSNSQRGWDLLVHASDGRPRFDAMDQKARDLMGRNWEMAFEVARARAELYPEEMLSWKGLHFYERATLGAAGMDSLRDVHRAHLRRYHQQFAAEAELSGNDAGEMFWYARMVEDSSLVAYWRNRLLSEHPTHPLAVQQRTMELWMEYRTDPERYLSAIERLWEEAGPAHELLMREGMETAQRLGSADAILRWANRSQGPYSEESFAEVLVRYPELREEGMRRLRSRIQRLEEGRDEDRDLFSTTAEYRRMNRIAMRPALAHLGEALIAGGETHAGLDTLTLALSGGWDPALFRRVANVRLSVGDTVGAVDVWAKVAVDPGTHSAFADTVQARAGQHFIPSRWTALVEAATDEMRERVLEGAVSLPARGSARVIDRDGRTHLLSELSGGTPAVIVFWSRFCGPAIEALPAIVRLSDRLRSEGVPLVLITGEAPSADFENFIAERGASLSIYHDTRQEAALAFNQWGTPEYFVLDPTGRIRFVQHSIGPVLRQVTVLRPE